MKCNFTFKHYNEIIKTALQNGYKFLLFGENYKKHKKIIYLRHDVDISPNNVLKMANIEHKKGIKAVYFYLLHDVFYGILEKRVFDDMKELLKMGHEIGLHFDPEFYKTKIKNYYDIEEAVLKDLEIFEKIIGRRIKAVSFHNPSIIGIFRNKFRSKKILNVYSDIFFKNIKYLSDSLQSWKEGCLCKILSQKKYNKIQILIHPCCWNNKELKPFQYAGNYAYTKAKILCNYLKKYNKTYSKISIPKITKGQNDYSK